MELGDPKGLEAAHWEQCWQLGVGWYLLTLYIHMVTGFGKAGH